MHRLSFSLAEARRTGGKLPFDPADRPPSEAEAYAVQAETAALLHTQAAGWKVGFGPDRQPLAAPIFACDFFADGATRRLAPGEEVKVEVEWAVRLGRDLPAGRAYALDDILAAASHMLVGVELVGSRYVDPPGAPFEAQLADNFNNAGFAAGAGVERFASLDRTAPALRLRIDGELVADHAGRHPEGDPLAPLLAWANAQADRLGGLRAGQIVTTGSLNAPYPLARPALIEAELAGLGRTTLRLA